MQRLLPPYLLYLLAALMLLIQLFSTGFLAGAIWVILGLLFLAAGLALTVSANRHFSRADTEINTFKTPRKLVRNGAFAYSRNPMYVGMLLFLIGLAILLRSVGVWIGPVLFFAASQFWYIPYEERAAAASFGAEYDDYRQQVRRWL